MLAWEYLVVLDGECQERDFTLVPRLDHEFINKLLQNLSMGNTVQHWHDILWFSSFGDVYNVTPRLAHLGTTK